MLFFQGMDRLPMSMNVRFWLYLNALPVLQDILIYGFLLVGTILIALSVRKFFSYRPNESPLPQQWLDSDIQNQKMQFLSNRRPSCKVKEMDTYYNSLIESKDVDTVPDVTTALTPLTEDIV